MPEQTPEAFDRSLHDIHIRPIRREDWHRLQLFHRRLSMRTVQLRFHGGKRELTAPLAHRFTDQDGRENVALVATRGSGGRIVGVARYCQTGPTEAEVAFVVEDAYQHHGIGSRLMKSLSQIARANGITEFVAEVMAENAPMFHLLREVGPTETQCRGSECTVRVSLLDKTDGGGAGSGC